MMKRYLNLLLATCLLAGCTLPFGDQPRIAAPTAGVRIEPTRALAPSATLAPANTPLPASTPQPPGPWPGAPTLEPGAAVDDPARIAAAQPIARDQLALAEALKGVGDLPKVARTTPLDVKVGDVETFWVRDNLNNTNYQVQARLRYAGPVVLMYVDTTLDAAVEQAALEQSAKQFEERVYPRDRELFGMELSPGIDGDPRLTILNTVVRGASGYFSGNDAVVKAVNRFSNEREMFVMNVNSVPVGTDGYVSTLAHEFQHMIEANQQPRSPLWFNEGMSQLAADLNGYVGQGHAVAYLANPDLQLTTFSQGSIDQRVFIAHYGASQLFLRYFYEQYAGEGGLAALIKADAGDNLEAFAAIAARRRPDIKHFSDIYADWAVANVLNDPSVGDGRYAYSLLPDRAPLAQIGSVETTTVSQFGVDYYGGLQGPLTIDFDGADTVGLTAARPADGRFMWWSNRGDESTETLERAFDLSGLQKATLQFSTWYELELNYDYAFVGVSTDGGKTWSALKGNTTGDEDPQGHNLGNGITGVSGAPGSATDAGTRGQWLEERMDLTPYAGKQILLRFWVVNDEGYNAPGMLIDDIRIPELGYSDGAESGDGGWQAQGFVRTVGELPQAWVLRLIRVKNGASTVEQPDVDAQGRATIQLGAAERGILAVIGATPFTTELASYSYAVTAP